MELTNYYFIFAIVFLWLVFASVQDLRKREIANWISFSLIGFGLAYKLVLGIFGNWNVFLYGILGFAVFYILALIVYYLGAVGGGDAKLLMAIGAILPSNGLEELVISGLVFLGLFLIVGAIYSLIYSAGVAISNGIRFRAGFGFIFKKIWKMYYFIIPLFISVVVFNLNFSIILLGVLLVILPILYAYTKAVDMCMIKLISCENLQEGDWIVNDIKIGNKLIKSRVVGLSADEIKMLRKAKRKVFVKYGAPFAPIFLVSLIMVFFFLKFQAQIWSQFSVFLF